MQFLLKLRVNLREAVRSLLSSLQRTLLALLGIVIGISSVIAMVSIGAIVKNEALRQFQEMGTDFVVISGLGETKDEPIGLRMVAKMHRLCPALASMAPYRVVWGKLQYRGQGFDTSIAGVTGEFQQVNKLGMVWGRPISNLDQEQFNCVLGNKFTEEFRRMGFTNPVGIKVTMLGNIFTIVGCLAKASDNALMPSEINEGVLVPIGTLKMITRIDKVDSIVSRLAPQASAELAEAQVRHAVRFVQKDSRVSIETAEALIAQMNTQMNLLTLLLGVVGSIALVVGGVGVMNVMLVSVSERRREIGIRRSIGAKQRDIRSQFLIESMLLCFVGGLLGIALGVGGAWGVAKYQQWLFIASPDAIWLGFGVSALVGIFFGYYPARQASRLRIIDALRSS